MPRLNDLPKINQVLVKQFKEKMSAIPHKGDTPENEIRIDAIKKLQEYLEITRMDIDSVDNVDLVMLIKANWNPVKAAKLLDEYVACYPENEYQIQLSLKL